MKQRPFSLRLDDFISKANKALSTDPNTFMLHCDKVKNHMFLYILYCLVILLLLGKQPHINFKLNIQPKSLHYKIKHSF